MKATTNMKKKFQSMECNQHNNDQSNGGVMIYHIEGQKRRVLKRNKKNKNNNNIITSILLSKCSKILLFGNAFIFALVQVYYSNTVTFQYDYNYNDLESMILEQVNNNFSPQSPLSKLRSLSLLYKGDNIETPADIIESNYTSIPFPQFITSSTYDNNSKDRSKPLFLIHPGPAKTATTSIQKGLWELRDELIKDNILFAGMSNTEYDPVEFSALQDKRCQDKVHPQRPTKKSKNHDIPDKSSQPDCWQQFVKRLKSLRKQNVNIIMSDERLGEKWGRYNDNKAGRFNWAALRKVLKKQGWDVQVLLSYRRQMDWLLSVKAQYDLMSGNRNWDGIPGMSNGFVIKPDWLVMMHDFFNQNPDKQMKIPPEESYSFGNLTNLPVHVSVGRYKTIEELYTSYHVDFELPKKKIHIWNMAQKSNKLTGKSTDLISTFVCHILPNATNACNAVTKPVVSDKSPVKERNDKRTSDNNNNHYGRDTTAAAPVAKKEFHANQAREYDYFRVVGHAARELNWINDVSKYNRQSVALQFERFYEQELGKSKADWPLSCPPREELEMYLQSSLMLEERLLPEFYNSNQGKVQHTEEFWKNANVKKKYCDIDPPTLLESSAETFKDFFQNKLVGKKL